MLKASLAAFYISKEKLNDVFVLKLLFLAEKVFRTWGRAPAPTHGHTALMDGAQTRGTDAPLKEDTPQKQNRPRKVWARPEKKSRNKDNSLRDSFFFFPVQQ